MIDLLHSRDLAIVLTVLYSAGKAIYHTTEDQDWAKRPLLPGRAR
jgi:hypothetical protein